MAIRDTPTGHGIPARLLHWGIAGLVAAAWLLGNFMEDLLPRGPARQAGLDRHAGLDAPVIGLSLLRLYRRAVNPAPPDPPGTPAWQARAVHPADVTLYAPTLAVPLSGVLDRWVRGRPLAPFGLIPMPPPFTPPFGRVWGEAHEVLANRLLLAVAADVAAALWHHLVLRDAVLRRMLLGRG
ncbi:cytochrome b [Dankookia sp. GCM10030260]|uniref:cytochrome b n=1 Tax=Dankookia sp. GCM10030260 TaxID=3273390 RepID=UPI00361D23D9